MPVSDAGTRNAAERDDAASADAGSVDVASSRWDVFCALDDAKNNLVGSCCHSDKADGTTTAPALPATPGLSIGGIGKIPLPVVGSHAAGAIKENAWEVQDKSYHGTFQIEPRRLRLCNPAWETSLNQIAQTAACKLGLDPDVMTAKLDSEFVGEGDAETRDTLASHRSFSRLFFLLRSAPVHGQRRPRRSLSEREQGEKRRGHFARPAAVDIYRWQDARVWREGPGSAGHRTAWPPSGSRCRRSELVRPRLCRRGRVFVPLHVPLRRRGVRVRGDRVRLSYPVAVLPALSRFSRAPQTRRESAPQRVGVVARAVVGEAAPRGEDHADTDGDEVRRHFSGISRDQVRFVRLLLTCGTHAGISSSDFTSAHSRNIAAPRRKLSR